MKKNLITVITLALVQFGTHRDPDDHDFAGDTKSK